MITLIAGRVGSGKKYFTELLTQRGLTQTSVIDGNIADIFADICIVTPEDIIPVTTANPDIAFKLIYIFAEDIERRFNYVKGNDKKIQAEETFASLDENEDSVQCDLEDKVRNIDKDTEWVPKNLIGIYQYMNNYSSNMMNTYADFIFRTVRTHKRMASIIIYLTQHDALTADENDNSKVMVTYKDGTRATPIDHFADTVLMDPTGYQCVMDAYLSIAESIGDADVV